MAHLSSPVAERISGYRPHHVPATWNRVAPLVRVGLAGYLPPSVKVVERIGRIVLAHVCACEARGADLSVPGVWAPPQVEHTLALGAGPWSARSTATMAAPLRRISRNLVPVGQPLQPVQFTRHGAQLPYCTDELATLMETVTTLESPRWRGRASLVLALTVGAGLRDADLRLLRPDSLVTDPGPVRVLVPDDAGRGRLVPVYRDFAPLAARAHALMLTHDRQSDADGAPVLFAAHGVSNRLWEQLALPPGIRPTGQRLRATWSAFVLASGCGLPAYVRAAHITSTDTWYASVPLLEPLDEHAYLTQVRGDSGDSGDSAGNRDSQAVAAGWPELDGNPWESPRVPLRDDVAITERTTTKSSSGKGARR
ncbi:hypothetical protein [Terrabacter aerolatus]|nr:hypothetical protein [Terrabacter aerolatus]